MRYYVGPAGRGRLLMVALLTVFLCELPYFAFTIVVGLNSNTTALIVGVVAILTAGFFAWPVVLRLLVNR